MGTLQFRLFASYLALLAVTLGLTALSFFFLLGGYRDTISYGNLEDIASLIDQQANAEIRSATDQGEAAPGGTDLLLLLRRFLSRREDSAASSPDTSVAIVDGHGSVIAAASGYQLQGLFLKDANLASPDRTPQRCKLPVPEGPTLLCVSTPISQSVLEQFPGAEVAAIVVAQPSAGLGEVIGDLVPRLVLAGLTGVAAALLLGALLSRSVSAPLRNIARAARSVARGNYRQRVPAAGPSEVRDLAADFNRMTEEVQRSQQTLKDFFINISHELKTPLTSIRGFSQALLDGTIDDPAGVQRSARVINDESARVLRLVGELLDLSRLESGQEPVRQDEFELRELFAHVGEVFAIRSEETGVRLDVRPEGGGRVRGDFDRLEQVLNNLLDNAFRHTPAGGTVRLSARHARRGLVQVSVADTGMGIPPAELPHLFERFYRANNGSNGRGHGLGLAITREIVRAHGGDIWATSEPGGGTVFTFTLPSSGQAARPTAAR